MIGVGAVVLIVGLAMMPLPGPELPIVLLGGAILARESSRAARALDWTEVRCRHAVDCAWKMWGQASASSKACLVLLIAANLTAACWAICTLTSLPARVYGLLP